MPWKKVLLRFVVAVLLTSCCDGQTDEEEERPHHLSHLESVLKLQPPAPARPGSLTFRHDQQGDSSSTKVSQLAAKVKRLNPSVRCGDNHMTLTVNRIKAPHFLVDTGAEPHTPLSQMPAACGFSVKRSRRDVQYATSYQGCHVSREDDAYVLPLLFQGAPMTMSCPNMFTLPAVVCLPSKMVVKLGGVGAKDLKIKVSGTWQPLPSACSSCGLTFKEVSGELALIAPYSLDLCVSLKDGEHSLSLQWRDYEVLAVCPAVPDTNPTAETTTPPSDSSQVLQHPQNPYLPMFSQMLQPWPPGPVPRAPSPQFVFVASNSPENQKVPEAESPALSFMPPLPRFFVLPRLEPPAQTYRIENTQVKQDQFPQMPLPLQYQVPLFSEFPMAPGIVQQETPSPPSATSTETLRTTSEPTTANKEKLQLSLQSQFPVLPQNPIPSVLKHPFHSEDKTQVDYPETGIEQLKPKHHNQVFQFPVLYSPLNYLSKEPNLLTVTAATSTSAGPTGSTPPGNSFYQPHPYMPVYLLPEQPSMPGFLHPPNKPSTNPAPSDQHEHQPVYHVMQPFYPFLPEQRQTAPAGSLK
ncbi:vegetative cell wall protein gp1 [Kryptolebias marmoratus]|uniref:vegetative cell wall protein gp1 n=1 Tax=Kryptolebias marmoratus TaxID=37003 RepID=UPI0007F8CCBF|nr:vegetative cell wall protein gp1 [Kryptolebias marmoratus]